MLSSSEVLQAIIKDSKNIEAIRTLTTSDVTYVSLNYDHPNLKKIMPWCGTSKGPDSIVQTFTDVSRYWETFDFKEEALFEAGENAAMFGQFTYRSVVLKKTVTSPFSVFAKVRNSRCFYLQFMEDTLATAESFHSSGSWTFRSNPSGEEVTF